MYGKLFSSMYDGTLATSGPWQALVTFQQMIVLADQDGVVDMTSDAISRRTSIPREIIDTGIAALSQPDPDSRSAQEEGRRIVLLEAHRSWGWQIVNHKKYRELRSSAERREYMRVAQAEHRAKVKASKNVMTNRDTDAFVSTSTDAPAPAPAPAYPNKTEDSPAAQALTAPPPSFSGDSNEAQIPAKARVLIAPNWELPTTWGEDAEKLGWTNSHILHQAEKFRQYWTAGKGSGMRRGIKGWRQSWSNWLGKAESMKGIS